MTQQQNLMDLKKLCCSICLDLLNDPVTIPCGHSYCMNCIKESWVEDEEGHRRRNCCPQCRQTFRPRIVLVKNTILADLVEELRKTGIHTAPEDPCYAGPEDVACDCCSGRKQKALKSCLQCLVSYCEQHLQPHYQSPAFEKHKLVDPFKKLQENICPRHGKVMKIFCCTDQLCICYLCSMDEHKGHDIVVAKIERIKKQAEIGPIRQKIQQKIQEREKYEKDYQEEGQKIINYVEEVMSNGKRVFNQLICLLRDRSSDMMQQIRLQQKTELSPFKELQEKLHQEITDLRNRDAELEQLTHIDDHIQFLHNYTSLSPISGSTDFPSINTLPLQYFEDATAAVHEFRDKLKDIVSDLWTKISVKESKVEASLPQAEPETRAEFLQYSCQITLDPNTANPLLKLSEGNRKATVASEKQSYPSQPDRFTDMFQVLNRESLSGRHYWEVERSRHEVSVAVTYKDISRAGYESGFGNDDKSWALECFKNSYEFRHNSVSIFVSGPLSSRVGVYLDHSAGVLSFYSVSETMTLLHRVQTTFTQPLCPGLGVFGTDGSGSTVEFCELK